VTQERQLGPGAARLLPSFARPAGRGSNRDAGLIWGLPLVTWWLAAIVATLPLEASKLLFPIQQLEVSRILMIPAVTWVVLQVLRGRRPMPRGLTLASAAVLGLLAVSLLSTRWPDGLLLTAAPAAYFAFAVFVAAAVRSEKDLKAVGVALAVSGIGVAAIAIVQVLTGWYLWREGQLNVLDRANATFADPNITARMLGIVVIVFLVGLAGSRVLRGGSILGFALLALAAAGLVMTQSRWSWAALAAVLLFWLLLERRNPRAYLGIGVFVLAVAITATLNATAISRASDIISGVEAAIGGPDRGGAGSLDPNQPTAFAPPRTVIGNALLRRLPIDGVRLYLLEAGMAMWEDHPLVGVGTGGFRPELLGTYRDFIPADRRNDPVLLPHTFLGQITAENGWVGLGVLATFLWAVSVSVRQMIQGTTPLIRSSAIACGMAVLLVFLTSQAEGRFFSEPYLWLSIGVLGALQRISREKRSGLEHPTSGSRDAPQTLVTARA